jgi:superfamily II DNA helicase RecQ
MDQYDKVTIEAMQQALGYHPHPFQLTVISHIIHMKLDSLNNPIQPTLLVQGIGSGKSLVYQCIGVIKQGVSVIIQNTLSLSSDQLSKINNVSHCIPCTFALQLDSIKDLQQQALLINTISSLSPTTNHTFFLFTSPECIIKEPW